MRPNITALSHDHIDGSAAMVDIIEQLYQNAGAKFPFESAREWRSYFRDPHVDMIAKFGTVTGVLQSEEALRLAGSAYVKHRARQGFTYIEAKFAPQYHIAGGLTLAQAVRAMHDGLKSGAIGTAASVDVLPVVCIGREATQDEGIAIANAVLEYDGDVALDLACDEAGHPPEKHLPAYYRTFGTNVRRDCHAGEWVSAEPADTERQRLLKNIRTAVTVLKVHSVGHARALCDDVELMKYMAGEGIRAAMCPLSNVATGLIKDVGELRIDEALRHGVCVTLDADDDLFLPPLSEVLDACEAAYRFSPTLCAQLEENARRGALMHRARSVHGVGR